MADLLLALDSSTRVIGWAVFRLDNLDKPLAYGVKKFNGDLHERLYQSGAWLDGKIQDYGWWGSMAVLAIEGQVVAKNAATTAKLAQHAGALKYVAMSHGLDIIEIAPGHMLGRSSPVGHLPQAAPVPRDIRDAWDGGRLRASGRAALLRQVRESILC